MANTRLSQLIIWILFFAYTLSAIVLYFWHHKFGNEIQLVNEKQTNIHGRISLIGIILCGAGMNIFRIFRGYRTRVIKYVHLVVQTIAVAFLIAGFVLAVDYSKKKAVTYMGVVNNTDYLLLHITSEVHITVGYMMFVAVLLQYVLAVLAFAYLFNNTRKRLFLAPFHEILGIWILISLVVTYLSGLFFLYDTEIGYMQLVKTPVRDMMAAITAPVYLSFLIVLIIVLTPYFEWELVGPL